MKIQNTLTKEELEMVLQYTTTLFTSPSPFARGREGEKLLNGLKRLKPNLFDELAGNKELYIKIFQMDTISAEVYAIICPDPPRMPEGFECPCCGRLLDEVEEEFNMEYTDEDIQLFDLETGKAIEKVLDLTNSFTKKHK